MPVRRNQSNYFCYGLWENVFLMKLIFPRILLWYYKTWDWHGLGKFSVFFENISMACWERIMAREWPSFVMMFGMVHTRSMLWVNQWNKLRGEWCKSDMKQSKWWDDVNINTITSAVSDDNGESSWQQCVGVPSLFSVLFVIVWGVRTYH